MRFAKVLVLLLGLGAVAGAAVGSVFVIVMGVLPRGDLRFSLPPIGYAAAFGAVVGALIGPPIALLFLRRVPIWRATVETAAGASLGFALSSMVSLPLSWVPLSIVGATLAAIRLNRAYRNAAPQVDGNAVKSPRD